MSLLYYLKGSNEAVLIEEKPFASGGEGALHQILSPARYINHVAKVFHIHKRGDFLREAKIIYLIENRPRFDYTPDHETIIWVEQAIYDEKSNFSGFIMPRASGEKLEILCAPNLPKHLGADWKRLSFSHKDSFRLRLKVCYNLASAIHQIHASGKYVLVDLKPDNVIIYPNGLISIVDTDSFEISENGKTIFPATVATPEYTPPEYYEGIRPGEVSIENSWDRFGLAVIFYRILFGIHPFAASAVPPYDNLVSLGDKIHHGLYVHHYKNKIFSVIPPPHRKFDSLDEELKSLFQTTFIDGHENPNNRISAEQWAMAFMSSPYLIVDRPLPSKSLELDVVILENWYEAAIEKAIAELKLTAPIPQLAKTINGQGQFITETLNDYKKAGRALMSMAKYGGLVLGIVAVFILIIGIFTDAFSFSSGFNILSNLIMIIPRLIFWFLINPIYLLLLLIPFFMTVGKKAWSSFTAGFNKTVQKIQESFALSKGQKRRGMEDKQYVLFSKRVKIKQKMQEIKTELNILEQVKSKKEENFQREYGQKIKETNILIQSDIKKESENIEQYDQKARELMKEEAKEIRLLRVEFINTLKNNPPYSEISGNSPEQKIASLEIWKKRQVGSEVEINQLAQKIELELLEMRAGLEAKITVIKTRFDEIHNNLVNSGKEHKIKIDDIVNSATAKIRIEGKLDAHLLDKNYKKLLKTRNELLAELYVEENNMTELNEQIKTVRDNLNKLR
jgi:serine/threonine protein kinase